MALASQGGDADGGPGGPREPPLISNTGADSGAMDTKAQAGCTPRCAITSSCRKASDKPLSACQCCLCATHFVVPIAIMATSDPQAVFRSPPEKIAMIWTLPTPSTKARAGYPVQQDALWNSVEVIQSRNHIPLARNTGARRSPSGRGRWLRWVPRRGVPVVMVLEVGRKPYKAA